MGFHVRRASAFLQAACFAAALSRCAHRAQVPTTPLATETFAEEERALTSVVCDDLAPTPDALALRDPTGPVQLRGDLGSRANTLSRADVLAESGRALAAAVRSQRQIAQMHAVARAEYGRHARGLADVRCLASAVVNTRAAVCSLRSHRALLGQALLGDDAAQVGHEWRLVTIGRERTMMLWATANQCVGEDPSAFHRPLRGSRSPDDDS